MKKAIKKGDKVKIVRFGSYWADKLKKEGLIGPFEVIRGSTGKSRWVIIRVPSRNFSIELPFDSVRLVNSKFEQFMKQIEEENKDEV